MIIVCVYSYTRGSFSSHFIIALYIIFAGFDSGDPFYDSAINHEKIRSWFEEHVQSVMRERGLSVSLELLRVTNPAKKPGPVFREIAIRAFDLGADYFFRVNDDTECRENWPRGSRKKYLKLLKVTFCCFQFLFGHSY